MASQLIVEAPDALLPLIQPKRYKAAHGGRGGAKSHFFAEQLVLRCFSKKTRVACIREVQATIKDSVRQLIVDKISKLGLDDYFDCLETEIRGIRGAAIGSLIVFKGMQTYNAHNIKSLEDFDIAWVEEAQTFSATSLRLLRPTIRKEGSEIWFSWNPRYHTDPVDAFFRGSKMREDAIVVEVNWFDNPWFPDILMKEKDQDYEDDPEMAEHVWGGGYEIISEAAYYAKHIAALEREGRVGHFPHIVHSPVYTGWDLGVDDYTAIWFFQIYHINLQPRVRIIDYYEASNMGADEIVTNALPEYTRDIQSRVEIQMELERDGSFEYQRHYLPHDVGMREWGAGAKTRVQTLNSLGFSIDSMHRGVAQKPQERVNASRRLLPICEFNQTKRVMLGLSRLRRYSRKKNEALGTYLGPLHDENSHGADAFGEFAINCGVFDQIAPEPELPAPPPGMFRPPPVHVPSTGRIKLTGR